MAKAARDTHPFEPTPGRVPEPRPADAPAVSLERGVAVLKAKLRTLPNAPGVYRMLDKRGDALYVGKARSLKKRVVAYTQPERLPYRLQRMVAETVTLEVVVTHTEVEALLLESNYIKRFMPRYNVLLRDDKSFPYILISGDHDFPQILKHRGSRGRPGDYFGPFASAGAVKQTLTSLQRAFLLRNCTDSMFASRTRPCLQYQIKRCTAPCVGYVTKEQYAEQVREARDFFSGKSRQIQEMLARRMQAASDAMDFEAAALFRDRIRGLSHIQSHQDVNVAGLEDADVIAAHQEGGATCIQVFFFRGGRNYGNRSYFPSHEKNLELPAVLAAFIGQFYDNKEPPRAILLSHVPDEQELLAEALAVSAGHRVELAVPQRGAKRKVIDQAVTNAREALGRRLAESSSQRKLLDGVAAAFGLDGPLDRVEVYDNSHVQGTNAIGAMIVAGPDGLMKNAYRKFNIRAAEVAGDDYGMMREVLTRRFARALKEDPDRETGAWPDLVLIDGGLGQLGVAVEVLAELGIEDVPLVAIAKGPERNAGRERFFMPGREPFSMELRDPVLYFLQRLRDEAHRFAIETHRAKRAKSLQRSSLDDVPGIGGKRKKALLLHFGSARAVERAGLADLETVEGISRATAKKIYDHFHDEG
ncbi:excinuclease ABC subunit UvrC [Oceanibaculum indicum]|uniref:UvrABC system protein C n=1 Tax=Oceanibaculum indicum P24 TaxID=1207063 RepID=K2JUN9_9PROT|nr:excinuclease ABC subunit C [Oceanibaculum indicum P24]